MCIFSFFVNTRLVFVLLTSLIIFWYFWCFCFFLVRWDLCVWRVFSRFMFTKRFSILSFSYYDLFIFDRYLVALFHTEYNFFTTYAVFEDERIMAKIRWYEHPFIYLFMSYYAVCRAEFEENLSLVSLVSGISFFSKWAKKLLFLKLKQKHHLVSHLSLLYFILYKHYYKHYMYLIFNNYNPENGILCYEEPQNLYFLILVFKTAQRNLMVKRYNIYKFLDFFVFLHTKKKKLN